MLFVFMMWNRPWGTSGRSLPLISRDTDHTRAAVGERGGCRCHRGAMWTSGQRSTQAAQYPHKMLRNSIWLKLPNKLMQGQLCTCLLHGIILKLKASSESCRGQEGQRWVIYSNFPIIRQRLKGWLKARSRCRGKPSDLWVLDGLFFF